MRLTQSDLFAITHYRTPNRQIKWFFDHLGIRVPYDRQGPILTHASYEAVLAKKLGVFPATEQAGGGGKVVHMKGNRNG